MLNYDSLKLAMLDLDGTLLEFPKAFLFKHTLDTYDLLKLEHPSLQVMEEAFEQFKFFDFVPNKLEKKFMEIYWESFDWNAYPSKPVLPGIIDVLKLFKSKGMVVAITTSRSESVEEVRENIIDSGLLEYVEHIQTRECPDIDWSNKVPQIEAVCKKYSIDPKNSLLAGDVPPDILSAKNAGVGISIAVETGGINRDILLESKPDFLLSSLAELLD